MAPLSATLEKDELPSDEPAAAASRQRNSDRAGARASTPSTTLRRVKCPSAQFLAEAAGRRPPPPRALALLPAGDGDGDVVGDGAARGGGGGGSAICIPEFRAVLRSLL